MGRVEKEIVEQRAEFVQNALIYLLNEVVSELDPERQDEIDDRVETILEEANEIE